MKKFDEAFYDQLIVKARASERLRANENIHNSYDDLVQRLFIAMEPGSYVRPHRHSENYKWEFFFVVRGSLAFFVFHENGQLKERIDLSAESGCQSIEIPPNTWHSTVALETGTVFFEVKQGPYVPLDDKDFASWAPDEGSDEVEAFINKILDT